jgi:uncharacterized protein (TIGR04255 family)
MSTYPVLKNPPLREAIFDVAIESSELDHIAALDKFRHSIKSEFPTQSVLINAEAKIEGIETEVTSQNATVTKMGYRLVSQDKNTVLTARINGFSVSFINQTYTKWENFYPHCNKLFLLYCECLAINTYKRVALRFINQIVFERTDLIQHYHSLLDVNKVWDTKVAGSYSQIRLVSNKSEAKAVVREIIEPSDKAITIFFDIDVNISSVAKISDIDSQFNILRDFKDEIFFASVKEPLHQKFNS